MNVAKNWALTIMLTALAFAHFSSELLLKEQMIIPIKKTLNSAGYINAKLIDFNEICQKNPAKSAVFYWLFLGEVFPKNFPWNRPIFLRICPENPSKFDFFPLQSREIGRFFCEFWLFSRENPAKSADFWAYFDFFPVKIPRNWPIFPRICPWKSREILGFFPRNIRSPVQTCQDCSPLAKTSGLSPQVPCFYYWATTKSYIFHKVHEELKAPWISES